MALLEKISITIQMSIDNQQDESIEERAIKDNINEITKNHYDYCITT